MSVPIVVQGTTINIPSSGESPNWAPAIIEAFQAIAQALSQVVGPFDVSPQTYVLVSNSNTNVDVPNLSFPISAVHGAFIRYTIYRNTTSTTVVETGLIFLAYNPSAGVGQKWLITREYVGDAKVTFSVTDVGQVQFSSSTLAGSTHNGIIIYSAQSL